MTGFAMQSTLVSCGQMDCFACARNDSMKRNLAPLVGRGRRRREAKSPGEGDYPQVRAGRESPSPARKMLATSLRKRGEVKNGRRAMDCFAEPVIGRAFARPVGSQ